VYLPAGHPVHEAANAAEYWPEVQLVHIVAPTAEYVPATQLRQETELVWPEYQLYM